MTSTLVAGPTADRAAASTRPTGPLSPPGGALFGSFIRPANGDMSQTSVKSAVMARESDLGRKLNIDDHNYGWSTYFPTWAETWDIDSGRIPMISWEAGDAGDIASGASDAMIAARADSIKGLGRQVFVNLFPQMDLQTAKGTPAEFIAAWRKVRNIFSSRGATNAVWAWCPSASAFSAGTAASYYPGDTYVDWVCAEGYNWAPGRTGSTWTSFYKIFQPFYSFGVTKNKPLMIAGTGAQERNAGEKASWIDAMAYSIKTSFPNIQAIVYTDAFATYDWRPNTSTGAYSAYKKMAGDLYFRPYAQTSTTPTDSAGTLLGAYVKPETGWNASDFQYAVTDLENRMGRKLDIGHQYIHWKESLGSWVTKWHLSNGRIPMVSWDSEVVTNINAGLEDEWIRQQADAVKALSQPVMIRYLWEMDLLTEDSVSPSAFVAAWRRIHTIFKNRGATNARWVWCPSAYSFTTGGAANWYPGDEYVDWIGADGYNWGTSSEQGKWRSFKDVFASFYAWAAPKNKPLMVGETGSQEGWYAGQKGQWITDMGATIKTTYPKMKALVYFDAYATSFGGGWFDWRLDSSWSSFDAWKRLGLDPYFTSSHNI
ncbi:MAG: hypothetical protein M3198_03835 [Actinomycetota bacterium]|nr:hypothetical protein [Actinomycetota bacterium]